MKGIILSLAMVVFALPAFAQSSDTQTGSSQQPVSAEKLKTQLSNAGFKQVQVLDTAFLVKAQTEDGNDVLMLINPPGAGTTSSINSNKNTQNSGSSTNK
ncbi:hypothetical protein [Mesorhizobium sp. ES1-3]|uniref:hypothetical protein n=1 Tax=Mesorhizobium sp. ES1-3 TaxID=2876628 RepID=UPI001CCA96DD|nr:hypothetical protein [Mesorhizobium sp. ES1-3]MBZ9674014.1 hypothetical protein [Mesorhizobium sp. ES1-3]